MQLSRNEIRVIKKQIRIHRGNEVAAFFLLIVVGLGFLGVVPFDYVHSTAFPLSIFLCIGLIASRPSADLKNLLQAAVNNDATNIVNASKS